MDQRDLSKTGTLDYFHLHKLYRKVRPWLSDRALCLPLFRTSFSDLYLHLLPSRIQHQPRMTIPLCDASDSESQ